MEENGKETKIERGEGYKIRRGKEDERREMENEERGQEMRRDGEGETEKEMGLKGWKKVEETKNMYTYGMEDGQRKGNARGLAVDGRKEHEM